MKARNAIPQSRIRPRANRRLRSLLKRIGQSGDVSLKPLAVHYDHSPSRPARRLEFGLRYWKSALLTGVCLISSVIVAQSTGQPLGAQRSHGPVKSVAVVLAEDSGVYYDQIVRGVEQGAHTIDPKISFTIRATKRDPDIQTSQLDELIRDGVDVIVIQRTYSGDTSPAVQRARQAGITVVAIDVDIPGGTEAVVRPDERLAGKLAAQYLARRLKGKGKVAIADGHSGPLRLRVAGFREEMATHPDIQIVEDEDTDMTKDGASKAVAGYLARHPDLDAIWGVNDPVAYYSEQVVTSTTKRHIVIVGTEGSPRSVEAMKSPERLIEASPGTDPFLLAERAVQLGIAIRRGDQAPGVTVLMPFVEVTRENVDGYQGWSH